MKCSETTNWALIIIYQFKQKRVRPYYHMKIKRYLSELVRNKNI